MRKLLVAGALVAAGVIVTAGPASAHDLNGGSAQKSCVPGDGVNVTWTFTSSNAAGHHIVSATFNRAVTSSSHTDTTVTAATNEKAGTSASLTATATFEDGFVTSHKVDTTIPTDLCPAPTTTTAPPVTTTAPPETITVPVVTTLPEVTTVPVGTTVPPSDSTVVNSTVPGPAVSVVQDTTPTTVCTPPGSPILPGATVCTLPTTGDNTDKELSLVLIIGTLAAILLLAARRRPVEA